MTRIMRCVITVILLLGLALALLPVPLAFAAGAHTHLVVSAGVHVSPLLREWHWTAAHLMARPTPTWLAHVVRVGPPQAPPFPPLALRG